MTHLRLYQVHRAARALIIYQLLYHYQMSEKYRQLQAFFYLAANEKPRKIPANQKTASRANSKKTGKTPSIKELETVNSIRFSLFSNEKLRQVRYFDHKSYRFNSVDPIINKDEALVNPQLWNLYSFCDNNPITFLDPDGREITKIEVFHGKSEVKFYSDSGKVYTSPAALGRPRSPSPKPGTTAYAEGVVHANPRDPAHRIPAARTGWDAKDNPGNPYGPYMVRLKKDKGEFNREKNNMKTHIHGTTGGWGKAGDTTHLGGKDPKKRRITSGCVRVPNADIRNIHKEGVKKNAPVYFKE